MKLINLILGYLDGIYNLWLWVAAPVTLGVLVLFFPVLFIIAMLVVLYGFYTYNRVLTGCGAVAGVRVKQSAFWTVFVLIILATIAVFWYAIHWSGETPSLLCKGNESHGLFLWWDLVDLYNNVTGC